MSADVTGPPGAPLMILVHPNPFEASSWLYQTAWFSAWFRCVCVDLPGYGRSPSARSGVGMRELADACWEAAERVTADDTGTELGAVLVGSSIGATVVQHMYHRKPDRVGAVVLCGAAWRPIKEFASVRARQYRREGLRFRATHARECFSASFRKSAVADYFLAMLLERNESTDLDTIVALFEALKIPDPSRLQADLRVPTLILSGTEDAAHGPARALHSRLPDSRFVPIADAGHACHLEQPRVCNQTVREFLHSVGYLVDHGSPAEPRQSR